MFCKCKQEVEEYLELSHEENTHYFYNNSAKRKYLNLIIKQHQRSTNLISILRNSQPVIFKNAKVTEVNARVNNGSGVKEAKETCKINKTWDSALRPEATEDTMGAISELE